MFPECCISPLVSILGVFMFPFACIPPKIIEYSHFPPGVTKGELQALGGMQAKVLFTRLHKELVNSGIILTFWHTI